MIYDFTYYNPTKIHFGKDSLKNLKGELANYGNTVLLAYGKNAIKKIGLYDELITILNESGKKVVELSGVMPNPTYEKVLEGASLVRENNVDLILAVGGGSVIDCAKAISVSAYCEDDPWEKYYIRFEDVTCKTIPVGCVLTMVGTGSEMNGGAVITNHKQKLKIGHVFGDNVFPKFSILNPKFTYSLPKYQMVSGCFDIMSHILEQYFSGEDDNTSDYIAEGLLRSLITSSKAAVKNPEDYEARSNIMWTATWALNTLIAMGKTTDWEVHMLGQAVGAHTDATHGMTLSAVSIPYYKYIMADGLQKFKRYAVNVWNVNPAGKTDEQIALEGLDCMESYMKEIGLVMNISEFGVTKDMIESVADSTLVMEGGYRVLTHEDIVNVLTASLS